ncbi:hypothetical protein MHYP_G00258340 [Metynnis hypsauchen]
MSQPAKLRVILEDHDIRKLTLPSGIPPSVENLKSKVQEAFGVQGEFALQYMDNDFGGQFFTLCSTDAIQDKDTIKVIYLAAPVEPPLCSDSDASEIVTLTLYEDTACSSSGSSADTVLLSPDRRSERAERASDFSQQTMNIFIVKKDGASEDDDYEDIGIVLEGQENSMTIWRHEQDDQTPRMLKGKSPLGGRSSGNSP